MRLLIAAIILPMLAVGATAQDAPVVPPQVQAMFPLGEEACYAASFSASDMKKGQKLTAFQMYRLFDPDPLQEAVQFTRDEAIVFDRSGQNGNWVDIAARFSDNPFLYSQTVSCYHNPEDGKVYCGADCDGGNFAATLKGSGIVADFSAGSGLSLNQSCGDPDDTGSNRWMTPREAGGRFTLSRSALDDCKAVDAQVKPAFVKDLPSLRQRIDQNGWRCMARRYDKAHLAKHSRQKVTAMTLAIDGPVKVDREAGSYPYTHVDVTLSFETRKGEVHERRVSCAAEAYQFRCDGGFRLRRSKGDSLLLLAGEGGEQAGVKPTMLDVPMDSDDRTFRLDLAAAADCRAD